MLTIEHLIRSVLPFGSNADYDPTVTSHDGTQPDFMTHWSKPPIWPVDMFAVIALLAKRTGAYAFVKPGLPYKSRPDGPEDICERTTTDPFGIFGDDGGYRFELTVIGHAWRHGLTLIDSGKISDKERRKSLKYSKDAIKDDPRIEHRVKDAVKKVARKERSRIDSYDKINKLWGTLLNDHRDDEIIQPMGPWEDFEIDPKRRKLFSKILKLLIISDEACTGMAQYYDPEKPMPWLINVLNDEFEERLESLNQDIKKLQIDDSDSVYITGVPDRFFTFAADRNVAPALPKARTASLGCSLRSLCRNVSLAPMSTEVETKWINMEGSKKDGLFNLLLIPFPFCMPHSCFKPYLSEEHLTDGIKSRPWRWFDIDQMWLPTPDQKDEREALIAQLVAIVKQGIKMSKEINGVVLPEAALDFDLFQKFAEELSEFDEIEVLISGTSTAPLSHLLHDGSPIIKLGDAEKHGNFVTTAIYLPRKSTAAPKDRYYISVQHKHHRWKLNKQQIIDYGAAFQLDPAYDWWENINISVRKLNFWSFRQHSVLATLICEDLARTDPAQQVIRSVGPSLLISILMDGPQFKKRWPGLYASSLAQDPGCSVLTMTSLGLLQDRPNGGRFTPTRNIALWADQVSSGTEISMAAGAAGVVLNITGNPCSTRSLDGRYQLGSARRWELVGVKDVFLEPHIDADARNKPGIFVPYRTS